MKNQVVKYAVLYLSLMAVFFLFGVISCWLPDQSIKKHVSQIAPVMQEQGCYPQAIIMDTACRQDNFTEALILNQIYNVDRKHPIRSSMMLMSHVYESGYDMTNSLLRSTCQESGGWFKLYPRYWHGNSFLFRVLLIFASYPALQWMMFAVSSLLLVLFLCTYYGRARIGKTLAFLLSWLLVYGFVSQFSIQFFPVLAIALVTSTLVVRHDSDLPYLSVLFFVVACLTCYFDLLTTPLLTFGWPLVVWVSLQDSATLRDRDHLSRMVGWGLLWVTGYALTFFTKWVLGSAFLEMNVLKDGFNQVFYRIGAEEFSRWDAVVQNIKMIPWIFVCIVFVVMMVLSVSHFRAKGWFKAVLLLVIGVMPYVWYLALSNHSFIHFWFTYRIQAITLAALFLSVQSLHRSDSLKR